jgi:exodeoxyribonuclease III
MRILTWNVNSIRLRLAALERLIADADPDVICLQEIKATAEVFPAEAIAALGFGHQIVRGMKGYNGVAILSRDKLAEGDSRDWCGRDDCRHVTAMLAGDVELHNFYVPAGGDEPDPEANPKFAHKLDFLDEMAAWFTEAPPGRRILVGDLNIAPLEADVWSHKQLLKVVSHTPVEVERLARVAASQGWVDAVRHFIPADQPLFTWWSYRNRTWPGSDRGRRLDHIWVTPPLVPALQGAQVLRATRGWDAPSDHVPVIAEISL